MINLLEIWKKYERYKDILGIIGGIWNYIGYIVRKLLLIFLVVIIVLKLYREFFFFGGAYVDIFRNEVVIVSYLFLNGLVLKSVYCGKGWEKVNMVKWLLLNLVRVYMGIFYRVFLIFFICMNIFKIKIWRKWENKFWKKCINFFSF